MQDILIIPNRTSDVQINDIHWIAYEESFKEYRKCLSNINSNNSSINERIIDSKLNVKFYINLSDYTSTHEDILNFDKQVNILSNNYYKINSDIIMFRYYIGYLGIYVNKFSVKIKDDIKDFFTTKKIPDYLKKFIEINNFMGYPTLIEDTILEILENIDQNKFLEFIKFKIYFDCFINNFYSIDFLKKIFGKISVNLLKLLKKFTDEKGIDFIKDLFCKNYFRNYFVEDNLFKFILEPVIYNDTNLLDSYLNKIYSYFNSNNFDLTNRNDSSNILYLLKFINEIYSYTGKDNVIKFEKDIGWLTDYLIATFYFWINENELDKIYEVIKFYSNMSLEDEFLAYYLQNFEKRIIYDSNVDLEENIFKYMKEIFANHLNNDILKKLGLLIEDLKDSREMVNEVKQLDISIKSNKYKNIPFDLNKINIITKSEFLWNEVPEKYNYFENNNINIYFEIIKSYYMKRHKSHLRKFNICYDSSYTDIKLGNSNFRMPCSYYYFLDIIGNNEGTGIEELINYSQVDKLYIENILKNLKKNNIIYESDNRYYFNDDILTSNLIENLCLENSDNNYDKDDNVNYDKDLMLDSSIVKICKQNSDQPFKISYVRLLSLLRSKLSKYFIITEDIVKTRIKKLIELDYIEEKVIGSSQMYNYIL